MKCLPHAKLHLAKGNVLHDWHAEILAIRAFNRFLVDGCADLAAKGLDGSQWLRRRDTKETNEEELQPYTIRDDVGIHMYCSEAPCGDASMELVMQEQEDDTPWDVPPPSSLSVRSAGGEAAATPELRGRGYFSELGIVRRKPARPDAPATLSKSCTDKLALKQCTSLLSGATSLLVNPRNAYLSTLVLPSSQYVPAAFDRAFSPTGRMASLCQDLGRTAEWKGGYGFHPFVAAPTNREFAWSRRAGGGKGGKKMLASNISAVFTPGWQETLIGGVLQGRKQFDARGASKVCRKGMWKAVSGVVELAAIPILAEALHQARYGDVKKHRVLANREKIKTLVTKEALSGWAKNIGDDDFSIAD